MSDTVIHIGYHKSASTFLQRTVFPRLPVNYLYLTGERAEILRLVESRTDFDPRVLRDWVAEQVERKYPGENNRLTVLSHEELSGHMQGWAPIDAFVTADNLKAAYPDAKILAVLRNQIEYLASVYTFRVAVWGEEFHDFESFLLRERDWGLFEHLRYDELLAYYVKLFGRDRVKVLLLEQLKDDPQAFLDEVHDYLGFHHRRYEKVRPVNESTKLLSVLRLWRAVNFVFNGLLWALHVITGTRDVRYVREAETGAYPFAGLRNGFYRFKQRLTARFNRWWSGGKRLRVDELPIGEEVSAYFGPSNARLEKLLDIDVGKYGYPVERDE